MHLELQKQGEKTNRAFEQKDRFAQADKKIVSPMQAALTPLALRMRSSRVIVEAVSQVNLEIHARNHQNAFDEARDVILGFIQRRSGSGELPLEAMRGFSFTLDEISSRRVECVAIDTPRYWTVRFDDHDKNVASRDWVIETAIADQDGGRSALFGLRLQCVARGDNPTYERTIPAFVRDLIKKCDVRLDGRKLSFNPIIVDSKEDVEDLVDLLQSPRRRSDVIVLSLPEESNDPCHTAISANSLLKDVAGAAHVAVITSHASFALSDLVGREFSVFRQAVRTYRPGFNPSADEPFAHPLGLAHRIADFNGGPDGYKRFLVSEVLRRTVDARDSNKRMPTFAEAKRISAQIRRQIAEKSGSSAKELLILAEDEIVDLKQALEKSKEEYSNLLEDAERERDNALAEVQRLKSTLHYFQSRMTYLENSNEYEKTNEIPDSLDDLQSWAEKNLAGAVELHNRALRGAKSSEYEDVNLIYNALMLLRDYYVPMKRYGGLDRKKAFENRCRSLGIEEQPTFSGDRAGEQGDTYFIQLGGRKFELDRHLKKGTSREPRHCFRLYFLWDESTEQVIVGWLPSHLTTRAS